MVVTVELQHIYCQPQAEPEPEPATAWATE